MDKQEILGLHVPESAREKLRVAREYAALRQEVREHAAAAQDLAMESITPALDFAHQLLSTPEATLAEDIERQNIVRSPAIFVEKNQGGEDIYMCVEGPTEDASDLKAYKFITFSGVKISPTEYSHIADRAGIRLKHYGKALDGQTIYGHTLKIELIFLPASGYEPERFSDIEAIEYRKTGSIQEVRVINNSVKLLGQALMTERINPAASTVYPSLVASLRATAGMS